MKQASRAVHAGRELGARSPLAPDLSLAAVHVYDELDDYDAVARGAVDQWTVENPRSMKLWHDFDRGFNQVEDREILRFVPALKRGLEMRAQQ